MNDRAGVPFEVREAAARGWRIHPVRPRTKIACLKDWQHRAATDIGQIESWARQFPGCNWGAVAGPDSGFFAVDVDDRGAMQSLEGEHGPVPDGLANVTAKGYQLIYQWPQRAEIRPATNRPCAGIDIRGRGSYIVIPPSTHPSGHKYRYSDPTLPIPPCPAWLLSLVLNPSQQGVQKRQGGQSAGAVVGASISEGSRTNHLVSLAGTMNRRGMDPAAIEAALLAENAMKCIPALSNAKVRAIAHDIPARYQNPQSIPEERPQLKLDLVCLADVEARSVDWLWEPLIPARMLTMVSGDPGAGKSFVALSVAAELSHGKLRDGRTIEPANTLYLTCENPIAECIRPRFDLLGGDARRLFVLKGTFVGDGEEQRGAVTLADISTLDAAIIETGARLIIVDPIQSYLGADVDLHRSNETRPVLDGLSKLAESHGCSVLLLRHLSKQSGGKAIHRGLGSIDLSGAVRSEILAGSLPDDPESRALVHIKSNVGRIGGTLGYSIDGDGRFSWTGDSQITASDLLASPESPEDRSARKDAIRWLADLLEQGSREQREVRKLAEGAGISFPTLRRAKDALRVRSCKSAMSGPWLWALPEGAHDSSEDAQENSVSTFAKLSTFESDCGGILQ